MKEMNVKEKHRMETKKRLLWTAGISVVYWLIVFLAFDVIYGINDDIMIESILSGGLTGQPSSMAVYMGQPLTSILAFLYQLVPVFPWLGIFQTGCYLLCFGMLIYRVTGWCDNRKNTVIGVCFVVLVFSAFCLSQFLLIHYTVTAAVIGSVGLFLVGTQGDDASTSEGLWGYLLLILSFLIRKQVFFLLFPFLLCILLFRILQNKKFIGTMIPAAICAGILLLFAGIHFLMYNVEGWKEYGAFNDARTRLYDYTGVWEGEAAEEYYAKLGITSEQLAIYRAYDLMLDEQISVERLNKMADFRPGEYGIKSPMAPSFREAIWLYRTRCFSFHQDFPYNFFALLLYALLFFVIVKCRDRKAAFLAVCLGLGRSVIWMYLILKGRMPERVSVSLYLIEEFTLFCMLWLLLRRKKEGNGLRKGMGILLMVVMSVVAVWTLYGAISSQKDAMEQMDGDDAIYEYFENHPENRYLMDVYATVNHTRYALGRNTGEMENYLTLGGWITASPLVEEKLKAWGYDTVKDALVSGEDVYFVIKKGAGISVDEVEQLLQAVSFKQVDCVPTDGESVFLIYQSIEE